MAGARRPANDVPWGPVSRMAWDKVRMVMRNPAGFLL
jgi:hypothetical protein